MRARSLVVGLLAGAGLALATALAPAAAAAPHTGGGGNDAGVSPFIVGGDPAGEQYSFMVSLQEGGSHFCGGSLIDSQWVLTAAHCIQGSSPGQVDVRVGSNDHTQGGEQAGVTELIPHPDYDGVSPGNDIALVKLDSQLRSEPISLGGSTAAGTQSRLLGWGQTCPERGCGSAPQQLQQLDTQLLDAGECSGIDSSLELCTDNPGGDSGACYGDSGGPQIVQADGTWQLIGVTSRSGNGDPTCATGPTIYTNAHSYTDWINQNTA